jgi:hypothetical protein
MFATRHLARSQPQHLAWRCRQLAETFTGVIMSLPRLAAAGTAETFA